MAHPSEPAELSVRPDGAGVVERSEPSRIETAEALPLAVARRLAGEGIERGAVQKPEELARLLALLLESPPRTVVEIGTDQGGSLYTYCQAADPEATIVSIDKPFGKFGTTVQERVPERVKTYVQGAQSLHRLSRDSHRKSTRRQLNKVLSGRSIDFLMIDGDHSYEGVRRDWELYSPLVSEGGIVAFHDILPHRTATECEVERFWREVREGRDYLEIIDEPEDDQGWGPWAGIGVITT